MSQYYKICIAIKVTLLTTNKKCYPFTYRKFSSMTKMTEIHSNLLQCVRSIVPEMTSTMYKGQCGRIGVIGGCKEYTGAPYFAAITALKLGADLSHIFCTEGAAPVIKSYSPELIVHPVLDKATCVQEIGEWLGRMHTLVIGPGLGRDADLLNNVASVIKQARALELPIVIDADGVFLLTQRPELITGYKKAILTPNGIEFIRLFEKVLGSTPSKGNMAANTMELSKALGGVNIVCKGENDNITDGDRLIVCDNQGSFRRCGGQGDLLSGSMGTFLYWAIKAQTQSNVQNELLQQFGPYLIAAYGACYLTRECNRFAFGKYKRSMTTTDMIASVGQVFEQLYENNGFQSNI